MYVNCVLKIRNNHSLFSDIVVQIKHLYSSLDVLTFNPNVLYYDLIVCNDFAITFSPFVLGIHFYFNMIL